MREIDYEIEEFLTNCQVKNLAPKTIKAYNQTLFLFAAFLEKKFGITSAEKVKPIHINNYVSYLQKRGKYDVETATFSYQPNYPERRQDYQKPLSVTTINNYIRNIKVFFNFLLEFELIEKQPTDKIKFLKNERKALDFISDAEFAELIKSLDLSAFSEYRDYIIIHLLLDTGMRIGECLSVSLDEIDFKYNSIKLLAENTKSKKDRTVFFSLQMRKMLKLWLRHKDKFNHTNLLFCNVSGDKLAINSFESNLKKYTKRIGTDKVITPKTFRNNFAKRFLLSGGDIYTLSKILGHSSVTVTEKAYLDITDNDLKKNYQNYSPLANMKKPY